MTRTPTTTQTLVRYMDGQARSLESLARSGKLTVRRHQQFGASRRPKWFADFTESTIYESGKYAGSEGVEITARLANELIVLGATSYDELDRLHAADSIGAVSEVAQ